MIVDLWRPTDDKHIHGLVPITGADQPVRAAARATPALPADRAGRCRCSSTACSPASRSPDYGVFRVIRDSDLEIEEEAEDLVRLFESAIKRRRRGQVVRLTIDGDMPDELKGFLMRQLVVEPENVFRLQDLIGLADTTQPDHQRPAGSPVRAVHRALSGADPRLRRRLLRRDPAQGHHRPSPLRELRHRGAVPAPGGAGRRRDRDQADAVPHQQRLADRAGAGRGRRGRQVGDRAGRDQGALRRGGQPSLGARPRAQRRAGRLRLPRSQDPRQDLAGRAPRGRRPAVLRPFRHRQLSPGDRQDVHGPVVLHLQPQPVPRCGLRRSTS